MSQCPDIQKWLDAVVKSSAELATTMLGLSGATLKETYTHLPPIELSSYISIVGDLAAVQIGIGASLKSCQDISKALMGMEPEEEDLPYDELCDAFSEITNILAGQVKTIISSEFDLQLNLGIPIFLKGEIIPSERAEIISASAEIDAIPVILSVIKGHNSSRSRAVSIKPKML